LFKSNPIKRIFELFTSNLSFEEIERVIKRDLPDAYEYFAQDIPKPDVSKNKFIRGLIFIRSLFNAFLLKLSAARRFFYIIALLLFLIGYFNQINSYLLLSFVILNVLLAFELSDKLTTKSELDLARKIQANLMQQKKIKNKHYTIVTHYQAAREVSGDYFEILHPAGDDERTFLFIGDISGKGVAAALYMVRVQAIIQLLINKTKSPKEIIIGLKKYFFQNLRKEFFLTIVGASIEKNGEMKICRAGHTPVIHYKKAENKFELISPKGLGIGFNDHGVFEKILEEKNIMPEKGDILLFYTDGLTETMNPYRTQFGLEEIKNIIQRNADKTVKEIKKLIIDSINIFQQDEPQSDDITLILLKKN